MEISGNCLAVNVKSLNHAYTAASLRLQPNRRSHGGRVYDHLALKQEKDFKPLEAIRVEHRKKVMGAIGVWKSRLSGIR